MGDTDVYKQFPSRISRDTGLRRLAAVCTNRGAAPGVGREGEVVSSAFRDGLATGGSLAPSLSDLLSIGSDRTGLMTPMRDDGVDHDAVKEESSPEPQQPPGDTIRTVEFQTGQLAPGTPDMIETGTSWVVGFAALVGAIRRGVKDPGKLAVIYEAGKKAGAIVGRNVAKAFDTKRVERTEPKEVDDTIREKEANDTIRELDRTADDPEPPGAIKSDMVPEKLPPVA